MQTEKRLHRALRHSTFVSVLRREESPRTTPFGPNAIRPYSRLTPIACPKMYDKVR